MGVQGSKRGSWAAPGAEKECRDHPCEKGIMAKTGGYGWGKSVVWWKVNNVLCLSVPFTWLLPKAERMAVAHEGPVYAGGPAVKLMGAPWADHVGDSTPFDVLSFHNPLATFTTRGCHRSCDFCAVPKIEGSFRELKTWKVAPIVCDNNILVSSRVHFQKVMDSMLGLPWVDFNQGLDPRLFTDWHAHQLGRLKKVMVRFAFDHISEESDVFRAVLIAKKAGFKRIGIYVLFGYDDTEEEAVHKMELVESWDCLPYPMRFQPLDRMEKNTYVADGWTENKLRAGGQRFHRIFYSGIPFEEFERGQKNQMDLPGLRPALNLAQKRKIKA